MATGPYNRYATTGRAIDQAQFDAGLRQHMLRVFNYMTVGLVITGLVAFFGSSSAAFVNLIFGTPLKWVVMFAPLAFIFFGFRPHTMSASTLQTMFYLFSGLMGLSLMSVFLVFTGESIVRVFFITAATFAGTALYGYTTRADLSKFGSFLFMGLIGIVIASLVNIFIGSSALQFAISVIGVLVFTGLTAYDAQKIKEMYYAGDGAEVATKKAVMGALNLYLDFINLFVFLLQFLGDRR